MSDKQQGLYDKYEVRKTDTGERVTGLAFVLLPGKDQNARVALAAYAESVRLENPALYQDIQIWLAQAG